MQMCPIRLPDRLLVFSHLHLPGLAFRVTGDSKEDLDAVEVTPVAGLDLEANNI